MKIGNTIRAISRWSVEIQWTNDMLLLWVPTISLSDFIKDSGLNIYNNKTGGIECKIQPWANKVCFDIVPVCEYFGFDPEEILPKGATND